MAAVTIRSPWEPAPTPPSGPTTSGARSKRIGWSLPPRSLEVPHEAVRTAAELGRARGVPVIVNPAPARPSARARPLGPIFTPNVGEAQRLTGETDPRKAAAVLAGRTAPVIVTTGSEGALLLEEPGAEHPLAPPPGVTAVDTTGAGDAFSGALAARIAAGEHLRAAAAFAVAAEACAVRARGARTSMPTAAEVHALTGRG